MSRALKLMKDSKNVVDDIVCTPKFIDLVFMKVKSKTEKRIDYYRFLDFLFVIACLKLLAVDISDRYNDDRILKISEFYDESLAFLQIPDYQRASIQSHTFGRLRGKAALITEFVFRYVSFSGDYRRMVKALQMRCNDSLSEKAILKAIKTIKHFFARCLKFHRWNGVDIFLRPCHALIFVSTDIRVHLRAMQIQKHQNAAATKIQSGIRAFLCRRVAAHRAQQVYFKYIDASSNYEYWYNSRTGVSFWTKPTQLRDLDCGFPVRLPADDTLFIVYCSVCEVKTLQCVCDECDELMCDGCYHKSHRTGIRKMHERIPIPSCVRCEFQVGTKMCLFCKDAYCDTCYEYEHRKGSFRFHMFDWLNDSCSICATRSALWVACRPETEYYEQSLCTVCCRSFYGDPTVSL